MTKRKEKEPLLYIQQPAIQFPSIKMQETFSSKNAESLIKAQITQSIEIDNKQASEEEKLPSKKLQKEAHDEAISNKNHLFQQEKVQNTIEQFETDRRKKETDKVFSFRTERKPSFQRVKSFKEMSIMERLQYLIEFPKQLPPVPCIFSANGETFKGFLSGQSSEFIEIKLFDGETKKINLQELEDIKMMGLRR